MLRLHNLLPATVIALTLSACAGNNGAPAGPATRSASAQVEVTNNNWADMNVYAERSGMRVRLGTVTSMGTRKFQLPPSILVSNGDFRLIADPIGSNHPYATSAIQVWPGQTVVFRIENHLAISSVSVW